MHMQTQSVQALKRPAPQNANHDFVARTMSTREIAELTRKSHDNVLRDARRLVADGVLTSEETLYIHPQNGQSYPEFLLSQRDSLVLVSGYSAQLRAKIIDRWQELESKLAPALPNNFAESLRLLATQVEENERVTQERDQAIATKAEIGNRREATAMATASAAVRRANKLESELGRNNRHATMTAVESALGMQLGKQGFRPLKKYCKDNGLTPEKVPCPRYGEVVAWPAAAWAEVYSIDLSKAFGGAA